MNVTDSGIAEAFQSTATGAARMGWRAPRDGHEADRTRDWRRVRSLCDCTRQGPTRRRCARQQLHQCP